MPLQREQSRLLAIVQSVSMPKVSAVAAVMAASVLRSPVVAQVQEVQARVRQLKRSLDLTEEELAVTRPMEASGAVSRIEILRLEKEANRLAGEGGLMISPPFT